MIPVPWVNHLAVGPGLPLSAPGESAPRPGAPELHFASRAMKTSLRAGFFWSIVIRRGTGAPYTWASREETLVPTLAAQTVLRVSYRKAATAADVLIWPTAAPLVRNSHRGWTPRSLTTIRSAARIAGSQSGVAPSLDPTNLRARESLRCPPSRRVPDKWSGRRPIDT